MILDSKSVSSVSQNCLNSSTTDLTFVFSASLLTFCVQSLIVKQAIIVKQKIKNLFLIIFNFLVFTTTYWGFSISSMSVVLFVKLAHNVHAFVLLGHFPFVAPGDGCYCLLPK